ncbi:PAS-domain containing protein [Terasakiella sp. SH-1]|uniref:PAS-domain containing protein n=1 Tax=Terasakiella sp. SH-1 TaxID=2560057 RepID=UPI0010744CC3|nr:PAS-domain containing protein [Terasakiella sp. SH-1]
MSDYAGLKNLTPETRLIVQALDQLDQGFSLFDADFNLCLYNQHFQSLFGYPDGFLKPGLPLENIIRYNIANSEYGPHFSEDILQERLKQLRLRKKLKITRTRPNGQVISVSTSPLPDGGLVTVYEDITEAHNTKAALEKRETEFRSYLELSPVGAILVELNGAIYYLNSRLLEIFGYEPDDTDDLSVLDFYANPDNRVELLAALHQNTIPTTFRCLGKRKNGKTFPMLLTSQIITIDGVRRIFSWVVDLSDITRAEQAIQNLSEQNKLILSAAGAGILGVDTHNIIQFINPAAAKLLGYDTDELKNKSLLNLIEDDAFYEANPNKPYHGESEIRCKSKRRLPIKITITPIQDEKGVSGKVVVFDDISERIAAEEVLRQAMKDIETTSQAKSHFLSTMSHELRTPLNAILGFAQILNNNTEGNLNEQQLNFVTHMFKAGEHLLKLINEAIDIAAIESGKVSLSLQTIDMQEIFLACIDLNLDFARKNDVIVQIKQSDDTQYLVLADHARLQQIMMHLISNAIKYNRKGGRVTLSCHQQEGGKIRIKVKDTGQGIPQGHQEDIFEPFNRLNAHSRGIEGTGLGLTICKHLSQLMGGKIGYTTTLNKGSSFWIDLPRCNKDTPFLVATNKN